METNTRFKQMEKEVAPVLDASPVTIVRMDGKSFSTFTRAMRQEHGPFAPDFTRAMIETTLYLAKNVPSCALAYTQSDEISLVLRINPETNGQHWLGGKLEKIVSITAAMASAKFATAHEWGDSLPIFDSRAFNAPDDEQVVREYLLERQASGIRNAIGMLAGEFFSHKTLMGVGTRQRVVMLAEKGIDVNEEIPVECKMGVVARRYLREEMVEYTDKRTGEVNRAIAKRSHWEHAPAVNESFLLSESD